MQDPYKDKIVEVLETTLATIFVGFGGFIFVKDMLARDEEEEGYYEKDI